MKRGRIISTMSLFAVVLILIPSFLAGLQTPEDEISDLQVGASFDDTILIEGDSAFNASNGISSGSGTAGDPYIIENKTIEVTDTIGIMIANTTKHLIIRNCTLSGGRSDMTSSIYVHNASNVNISHTKIDQGCMGIYMIDSRNIDMFDVVINTSMNGIAMSDIDNVTIHHSRFEDNQIGIQMVSGIDLRISHSIYRNNSLYGMGMRYVGRVRIDNNSLLTNYVGLAIEGSSRDLQVKDNNISNNDGDGFTFRDGFNNVLIQGNNISSNGQDGISISYLTGSNIIFTENRITHNQGSGLYINGDEVEIRNNTISNNMLDGIWLDRHSDQNIIISNTIENNGRQGINVVDGSDYNIIQYNKLSLNGDGISLYRASSNQVSFNRISKNVFDGVSISHYGDNNRIIENEIYENGIRGVLINSGDYNDLINNTFRSNVFLAIEITGSYSSYNNILNNTFRGDVPSAIGVDHGRYNDISNNYFLNNNTAISFGSARSIDVWNNYFETTEMRFYDQDLDEIDWNRYRKLEETNIVGGPYIYGNYWPDYEGDDMDGDGIGDTDLPHGPGDEGPIVKEIPPPDITPPTLIDLTTIRPETGELFNASFRVMDDRNIFGMEINGEMRIYSELYGLEDDYYFETIEPGEDGSFDLSCAVDSEANYLILDINLTDFCGNMANFSFNYTVEDVIPPWITGYWWEEEARSGENFTIYFGIWDNIGVSGCYLEYYMDNMLDEVGRFDPLPESTEVYLPIFNISVGDLTGRVTFRLTFTDINDLMNVSDWYSVSVVDATPPSIEDITGGPPRSNMDYHMRFRISDNKGVASIEIVAIFDMDTEMEKEDRTLKFRPFSDIWEVAIPVPWTSYTMTYTVTIWDKLRNENVLEKELEVIDSVPPHILDITTESPVTENDHFLFFSTSDNEEVNDGFFEYWYDDGPPVNLSGIPDNIRIENILASALILNYRAGVKDIDGNWMIIDKAIPIVDATPPRVVLLHEIPYTSHVFKVWVSATDNREVRETSLKYSLNGDSAQILAIFSGQYFEIELSPEVYKITLYGVAKDSNKNENMTKVELQVQDGSPPIIDFKEAIIGPDGTISIYFTCEDNREMGPVWVILTGENGDFFNITTYEADGIDHIIQFQQKGLGKQFNYSIHAMDAGGNVISTQERTMILPQDEDGSRSNFWVVLLITMILLIVAIAIGVAIIMRSRSESRENQVEVEKIKEVFDHFEVGTKRKDMDCYKVLGVQQSATVQEITRSYRGLALVHHPDKIGNGASVDDAEMKRINCAKAILLDPEKRAILDRYLGPR